MKKTPLAEQLRPKKIEEILGKNKIFSKNSWLVKSINNNHPLSILLYGPPGSGKTTFARIYGKSFLGSFISLNGVNGTVAEIKKIILKQKEYPLVHDQVILFVDEIHRLNKAQQDIFLPYLEDATFVLIAATTENPSFALNNALLSRLRVITLNSLDSSEMSLLFEQYKNKSGKINLDNKALKYLIQVSSGDARFFLNCIEDLEQQDKKFLVFDDVLEILSKKKANYDRDGDFHYQLISALHKSIRGSDPDASLYWLCRMLDAGEDPKYIIRRLIRVASEDIGLSDPNALGVAMSVHNIYQVLGSPEGDLAIAELVLYLSLAPKSNSTYAAFKEAMQSAKGSSHLFPPKHIVNAPTKWMKTEGFGEGYIYDHETKFSFSGQNYFPKDLERMKFYKPKEVGFEREMSKRIKYFENLRKKINPL